MTVAVVVFCPADVVQAAQGWGLAGLVADSFWVCAEDAGQMDPDHPNSIPAVRIDSGRVHESAPLVLSLHQLGALDEVRVAWIRPPDEALSQSLKSLEHLLREMLPPDTTHWLDIVVPARRTDRTVVPLPGQWVQLRLVAEDRSAPDVTDAGWDLGLDVALHAALAAVGVLGGTFDRLPWAVRDAGDHYEFRAFSRLLVGANDSERESHRFVARTLPGASAGTFFPDRYLELDDEASRSMVDNALDYILSMESGALSYRDPEPSQFLAPPRLTIREHLIVIWRFIGHCLRVVLRIRPRPVSAVQSKLDFDDLGYNVGEPGKPVPVVWTTQPADFDVLDARAAEYARQTLVKFERELSRPTPITPARTWRVLTRLATSLNDGGPRPDGWDPPSIHDRQPVLAPRWVQPTPASVVTTSIPELATARNPSIGALAVNDARRSRSKALVAPDNTTRVVTTAQDLASEGNELDGQRLAEQLSELDAPSAAEPISFLDRLSGRLIGAGLRARLDAERWSEFATAPTQPERSTWSAAERTFRKRALIGLAASVCAHIIWAILAYVLRGKLPAWLTLPAGLSIVAAATGIYLLWCVYAFFKVYSAYLERSRRKLELRRMWLQRACHALREAARLREPRRIHTKWLDLLDSVFPLDETPPAPSDRLLPAKPPKATAIASPDYTSREMTKWLADEGAEVGWRYRALRDIASGALEVPPDDAITRLVDDSGLQGGPLHEIWAQRGLLWRAYADLLRRELAVDVAARMVASPDRSVTLLAPPHHERRPTTVSAFRDELWPDTHDDEGDLWPTDQDYEVHAGRHGRGADARPNPDLCQVSVRIQLRRVAGRSESADCERDLSATDGDEHY